MDFNFTEIRFFVLFYELKNTFVTPLHLSSLFTTAQTDQSSRFPAQNWTCSIRCRKLWQTDQFLVPVDWYQKQASETGQCVITISLWKAKELTHLMHKNTTDWSLWLLAYT